MTEYERLREVGRINRAYEDVIQWHRNRLSDLEEKAECERIAIAAKIAERDANLKEIESRR